MTLPDRFVDFDRLFGERYDHFIGSQLTDDQAVSEVDEIVRVQALEPGSRVLDVHCGYGRHANVLARRGYRVVGLDRMERFIERARADARREQLDVEYWHMDVRELDVHEEFDSCYSWFGSFGYSDDETELDVLTRIRRALRAGGTFLLDMQSPYRMIPALIAGQGTTTYYSRIGDDVAFDVRTLDATASRVHGKLITARGGLIEEADYAVRAFTAPEICSWFAAAGFTASEVTGEGGTPFTVQSRRLVILGRR